MIEWGQWLVSLFFLVELITTARAARVTRSNWVAERLRRRRPTPNDAQETVPIEPSVRRLRESDEVPLAELGRVRKTNRDDGSWGEDDEVSLGRMLRMNGGDKEREQGLRS